jgi:hypothetical protein
MMIVKSRNDGTENWVVYNKDVGATKRAILNGTAAFTTRAVWGDTAPTATNFYVGGSGVMGEVNSAATQGLERLFKLTVDLQQAHDLFS